MGQFLNSEQFIGIELAILAYMVPKHRRRYNFSLGPLSRLTIVSRAAKSSRNAHRKTNDVTTTRKDFTGMNVVQIRLACNLPSTNAIALKL